MLGMLGIPTLEGMSVRVGGYHQWERAAVPSPRVVSSQRHASPALANLRPQRHLRAEDLNGASWLRFLFSHGRMSSSPLKRSSIGRTVDPNNKTEFVTTSKRRQTFSLSNNLS